MNFKKHKYKTKLLPSTQIFLSSPNWQNWQRGADISEKWPSPFLSPYTWKACFHQYLRCCLVWWLKYNKVEAAICIMVASLKGLYSVSVYIISWDWKETNYNRNRSNTFFEFSDVFKYSIFFPADPVDLRGSESEPPTVS